MCLSVWENMDSADAASNMPGFKRSRFDWWISCSSSEPQIKPGYLKSNTGGIPAFIFIFLADEFEYAVITVYQNKGNANSQNGMKIQ